MHMVMFASLSIAFVWMTEPVHAQGVIRLNEGGGGANYSGFQAPASIGANLLWVLPGADGTLNQCLTTNGSGTLSWVSPGASPGNVKIDGTVPMTGTIVGSAGAAATPSITFASDTDNGFFYASATTTDMNVGGGSAEYRFATGGFAGGVNLSFNGTGANVPSYGYNGDSDTGIYRIAADTLGLSAGAIERVRITSTGLVGINSTNPQATLDIYGELRLKKNGSAPVSCGSSYNGRLSLTSGNTACICNGTAWVKANDGTTACVW